MESATYGATQARSVDAGRGVSWWGEGWALFMKNAGMWVVMALIFLIICIVLSVIPILGGLALALLFPVFIGGFLMAAYKLEAGGTLEVGDLFAGFKEKLTPLVVLGGIVLGATIVMWIVIAALGVGAAVGMGSGQATGAGFFAILLAGLIGLAFGVLVGMAMWFAPALVVFHDTPPVDAIKLSFAAGLKNIIAFLIFGVLYLVAAVVASIPFGLGWLVLIPVLMLTMYASYKDVFGR
ncbi:BPSS1780 family membrane protein [Aquabacterium sp.]|uniref:BPSS1780 family membrane protein n=1 Tax=Aquabacterium sp. TaxID=1872578 RepID=UPI002B84DD83|nr:BPSS1780 family membrane protein [Aquabacterium sp.]HSW06705.1 BPSS1780 family membrane protein [Aquabacterium sp.]